MFDQTIGMRF